MPSASASAHDNYRRTAQGETRRTGKKEMKEMESNDIAVSLAPPPPAPSEVKTEPGPTPAHQLAWPAWIVATATVVTMALALFSKFGNPKWEYKITNPPDSGFEKSVNDAGAEGWEMVTARRATGKDSLERPCYEIIWKRKGELVEKEKKPWER